MVLIDIVLIIIIAGFTFYGLFHGFIKMIGYLIGLIIGAWVASHYYEQVYNWLNWMFFDHENLGKVIAFILVLGVAVKIISWAFDLLDKAINIASVIPFVKGINKLAGAIFGFIEGTLFLGLIIYVASRYTLIDTFLADQLVGSQIAPHLLRAVNLISPFFPEALRVLRSLI
ncbi:MAG TPA: CvpA family protein [bacterium]|nr:CvpA family protein [bacterium]HPT30040.1 CvpA family protein [bacterium]